MLDQQDIKQIGEIVEQKVNSAFDRKFDAAFDRKFPAAFDAAFDRKFPAAFDAAFDRKIDSAIEQKILPQIAEMIDQNILPQFETINSRLDKIERDMVTKDYLDDKLGDLKGDLVAIDRKQDKKVNFLIESLDTNEVLPDSDIKLLRQMEVFPSPPRPNI